MIRSDLVQRHFSQGMEVDDDGTCSYLWRGQRYASKPLSA
jgi:hypothetical protein